MVKKFSHILWCALFVGGAFPEIACAMMDEQGEHSTPPSRAAENVERETAIAGEKIGKVLKKAVEQTEAAVEKAADQTGKGVEKAAGQTERGLTKAAHQIGKGLRKFAGHFSRKE